MRWLFLAVALVAGTAQSQDRPPKKESKATAQQRAPKNVGTKERPFVVTVEPNESDKKEADRREEERKEKAQTDRDLAKWTKVLAWIAGLQFVALCIQAWIFRTQANRLKETIGEMKVATQSTKTSVDSYKLAERAWVSHVKVETIEFTGSTVPGVVGPVDGVAFILKWTNAGRTPSINTMLFREGAVVAKTAAVPTFERPPDDSEQRAAPLVPGQKVTSPPFPITEETVERLKRRECRVFIYGLVEYDDVFHAGIRHLTETCQEVSWRGVGETPDGVRIRLFTFTAIGPQNRAT